MLKLGDEEENNDSSSSLRHTWTTLAIMTFALVLVATVFSLVGLYAKDLKPPRPDPPHIIFILVDDLGWNDVSFHGSVEIPTPNIDALAATGIILNNYYTHPHCTPSRGAFLSGKYANRIGLNRDDLRPLEPVGLPLEIVTLPQYLKRLGYSAHLVGKWHLGYHKPEYLPRRRGFDTFFGNLNEQIDYFDYTVLTNGDGSVQVPPMFGIDLWENERLIANYRGKYVTELYGEKAVELILNHNGTDPIFLFISLTACHLGNSYMPLQAPPEQVSKNKHIDDGERRTFAGMISSVDEMIGKVFEALNGKGMLGESVIVFSSDNGGLTKAWSGGASSNWPLRGMKYSLWEGGVRATALVWSPLLRLEKPRTSMQMMHITDWLPTFYFAAGGDLRDLEDIDGVNMWPALFEETTPSPRNEILIHIDPVKNVSALRQGDMKLLFGLNSENGWYGPTGEEYANVSDSLDAWVWSRDSAVKSILEVSGLWLINDNDTWRQNATISCGVNFMPESGKCDLDEGPCLYNVTDDPCEFRNLAPLYPEVVEAMMSRIIEMNASSVPPVRKDMDLRGDPRCLAFSYEPWLDLEVENSDCPWV